METTLTLADFMAMPIVATAMSLFIQWLKLVLPEVSPRFITLVSAVLFGSAYYYLSDTSFFVSVVAILGLSSTVYGLLLKERTDIDEQG